MARIYLFDWGDTLMVDLPNQQGKMCNWEQVYGVEGAIETLAELSKKHAIYIATNAADSSEADIQSAFARVGLARYIKGYFCKSNLGIGKGTPAFFYKIIERLGVNPESLLMVGDSYQNDIAPAIKAGVDAIWFNPTQRSNDTCFPIRQIQKLTDLCEQQF